MNTHFLTSPFFIAYAVVIILIYLAGSALKRLTQQTSKRRSARPVHEAGDVHSQHEAARLAMRSRKGTSVLIVRADWVAERQTWASFSDDLPALQTEAETFDALATKLEVLCSDLLASGVADKNIGRNLCAIELVACRVLTVTANS